jgi:hypothetical protein
MITLPERLPLLLANTALSMLSNGQEIENFHIVGKLDLRELLSDETSCPYPIVLKHCRLDQLTSVLVHYERPVVLWQCHFLSADFTYTYFLQGLRLEECVFEKYLDFQAGGHNQPGFSVLLARNVFRGFVNFFDCWYQAEVQIVFNEFRGETNLLNYAKNYTTFEVPPIIQSNTGNQYRSDESE